MAEGMAVFFAVWALILGTIAGPEAIRRRYNTSIVSRPLAVVAVAISCLACDIQSRLADLERLTVAMESQFHETVEINKRPGDVLTLTVVLPQQTAEKFSPEAAAQYGFRIAQFARAHYVRAATLHMIAVQFVARQTVGPLVVGHTYDGGSWPIATLAADSVAGGRDSNQGQRMLPQHP